MTQISTCTREFPVIHIALTSYRVNLGIIVHSASAFLSLFNIVFTHFKRISLTFSKALLWLCRWTFPAQYWSAISFSGFCRDASLSRTFARSRIVSSLILRMHSTRRNDKIICSKTVRLLLISWSFKIASKSAKQLPPTGWAVLFTMYESSHSRHSKQLRSAQTLQMFVRAKDLQSVVDTDSSFLPILFNRSALRGSDHNM